MYLETFELELSYGSLTWQHCTEKVTLCVLAGVGERGEEVEREVRLV